MRSAHRAARASTSRSRSSSCHSSGRSAMIRRHSAFPAGPVPRGACGALRRRSRGLVRVPLPPAVTRGHGDASPASARRWLAMQAAGDGIIEVAGVAGDQLLDDYARRQPPSIRAGLTHEARVSAAPASCVRQCANRERLPSPVPSECLGVAPPGGVRLNPVGHSAVGTIRPPQSSVAEGPRRRASERRCGLRFGAAFPRSWLSVARHSLTISGSGAEFAAAVVAYRWRRLRSTPSMSAASTIR